MKFSWPGMTTSDRYERHRRVMDMLRRQQHFAEHSLRLVADNSAPVRRKQPIRGIRIINGQDDGGPDAA